MNIQYDSNGQPYVEFKNVRITVAERRGASDWEGSRRYLNIRAYRGDGTNALHSGADIPIDSDRKGHPQGGVGGDGAADKLKRRRQARPAAHSFRGPDERLQGCHSTDKPLPRPIQPDRVGLRRQVCALLSPQEVGNSLRVRTRRMWEPFKNPIGIKAAQPDDLADALRRLRPERNPDGVTKRVRLRSQMVVQHGPQEWRPGHGRCARVVKTVHEYGISECAGKVDEAAVADPE